MGPEPHTPVHTATATMSGKHDKTPIKILSGLADWPIWQVRSTARLDKRNCAGLINWPGKGDNPTVLPEVPAATADPEQLELINKARSTIIETLSDDLIMFLVGNDDDTKHPQAIVNSLYKHFYVKTGTSLIQILQELGQIRMLASETPDEFAARINRSANLAKQMGGEITDASKIAWFRSGLPESTLWIPFKASLDSADALPADTPGKAISLEFNTLVKSATLFHASIQKHMKADNKPVVLAAPGNQRDSKLCGRCHKGNHSPLYCWAPLSRDDIQKRNQGPTGNRGGNRTQDRDRHPNKQPPTPCKWCQGPHWNRDCPDKRQVTCAAFADTLQLVKYIMDSGATEHCSPTKQEFNEYTPTAANIEVFGGTKVKAIGVGTLRDFPGVAYHVPKAQSILSIKQLQKHGWSADFNKDEHLYITMPSGNQIVLPPGKLHHIDRTCLVLTSEEQGAKNMLQFHAICGHILDPQRLRDAAAQRKVSIKDWPKELPDCTACITAKARRAPVNHQPRERNANLKPGQRLHADLVGPTETGEYILDIVDEASRYEMCAFMQYKSDTATTMGKIIDNNYNDTMFGPEELHSDRGTEFTGQNFIDLCKERDIRQTFSAPYTPEHNGLAERTHGVTLGMTRAMLAAATSTLEAAGLSKNKFLKSCYQLAVYIRNTTPTAALGSKTPFETFKGRPPASFNTLPFATPIAFHTKNKAKFGVRTTRGLYMGPAPNVVGGAIIVYSLETGQHIITRSYKPIPHDVKYEPIPELIDESDSEDESEDEGIAMHRAKPQGERAVHQGEPADGQGEKERDETPFATPEKQVDRVAVYQPPVPSNLKTRGFDTPFLEGRTRKQTKQIRAEKEQGMNQPRALLTVSGEPSTYSEAMTMPDAAQWHDATRREILPLLQDKAIEIVPADPANKPIKSRLVYKLKADNTYKARLVACGYSQQFGIDYFDTSAPVVSKDAVRILFAIAASNQWHLEQFDFNQAYINANLDITQYMLPPLGFTKCISDAVSKREIKLLESGQAHIKVNKALYGLKQSGRLWSDDLRATLIGMGLKPSEIDPCVFYGPDFVVIIYVDDGIIMSKTASAAEQFLVQLQREYELKVLGRPKRFLGLNINYHLDGSIFLHQKDYAERIGARFATGIFAKETPIGLDAALAADSPPGDRTFFMECVGSLNFAAVTTRPDISFAVSAESRHMQDPTVAHVGLARRTAAYLAATSTTGLLYKHVPSIDIELYSDASFAPDHSDSRKSQSGWLVMINGTPVSWRSARQPIIALSTAEAEYIAMSDSAREAITILRLVNEIGFNVQGPITAHQDNLSAKSMAEQVATKRSKHIDLRYHYVRHLVANGDINIKFCRTNDMLADALTKALPRDTFVSLRNRFMAKGEC